MVIWDKTTLSTHCLHFPNSRGIISQVSTTSICYGSGEQGCFFMRMWKAFHSSFPKQVILPKTVYMILSVIILSILPNLLICYFFKHNHLKKTQLINSRQTISIWIHVLKSWMPTFAFWKNLCLNSSAAVGLQEKGELLVFKHSVNFYLQKWEPFSWAAT